MSVIFKYFVVLTFLVTSCFAYVAQMKERDVRLQAPNENRNLETYRPRRAQSNVFSRPSFRRKALEGDNFQDSLNKERREPTDQKKGLEAVMLSIDTGAKPDARKYNTGEDTVDKFVSMLKDMASSDKHDSPIYRAREEYGIKPEYINLRASEQPSMKFEINSQNVMKALEKLLSSPMTRRYTDLAAKHAAAYYKVIVDDLKQQSLNNERK